MESLFTNLTHAIAGAPLIALVAAVVWGILSILLSPCHLASIPLIVGFISEQGQMTARRAFWTSTLFAVGILLTIASITNAPATDVELAAQPLTERSEILLGLPPPKMIATPLHAGKIM